MISILLFGLCGTGKSTFGKRAYQKYGVPTIQVRRLFELVVGRENASKVYHQLCNDSGSRTAWLDVISDKIKSNVMGHECVVIEGIFTKAEAEWFEAFSSVYVIYIENNDYGKRLARFSEREGLDEEGAKVKLSKSDEGRSDAGVCYAKDFADHIIANDGTFESFHIEVDSIIEQVKNFPSLTELCHHVNKVRDFHYAPYEVAYYIRQLSIADGCKNACIHCFSNSPSKVTQTSLSGFQKIISEVGEVVERTGRPLPFFHLGASTDPASVKGYSNYLRIWRASIPESQAIRVFTHGWDLTDKLQSMEFDSTLSVATMHGSIKFVISFDTFSIFARNDWDGYLMNVALMLRRVVDAVGKSRVRMEVFYNLSRNTCKDKYTLQYWRELASREECPSINDILDICENAESSDDRTCAKVTAGMLVVFKQAGLCSSDLVDMSRDCETVFDAGRARQLYQNENQEAIQKGLDIQKKHVLYSLEGYEHKYEGVIIYPDGTARLVDYHGFNLLERLNDGKKVISCMSSAVYDDETSRSIRKVILEMSYRAQVAHIPSAFSMTDYLGVLFESVISPYTHRFVLGKPFGAQAYYALFSHYGWIGNDLSKYGSMDPEWRYIIQKTHPHITYIDETMGNCLSVACGIALAGRNVFVNISDAAFQEGTVWESALFAGANHLSRIIMAVDNNNMQALGSISDILDIGSLEQKLESFGWEVYSCDGHDLNSLHDLAQKLSSAESAKPVALVMHTVKGHGVSFIEGDSSWHYKLLNESDYQNAVKELV